MQHSHGRLWVSAVVVASLTLVGCSPDLPSGNSTDVTGAPAELTNAAKDGMLERVGRGLALALKDQTVRRWVSNEISSSPYVEYRIPIRDKILNGSTRSELRAVRRATGLQAEDLVALRAFPHLELYLPLEYQRANWRGAADVQVAVRRSTEEYTLFQTDGSRRVVPENYLPSKTTLVLAVSEIDYSDAETSLRGGRNTGDGMRQSFAPARLTRPTFSVVSAATWTAMGWDPTHWTRSYFQRVVVQHDGGLAGDDEMEIYGDRGGSYYECRRYTGLKRDVPYTRDYGSNPLGVSEAVALAVPTSFTNLHIDAYEDDGGTHCGLDASDDYYGSLDYQASQYNVSRPLRFNNGYGPFGDADLGMRAYVNGQPDPLP